MGDASIPEFRQISGLVKEVCHASDSWGWSCRQRMIRRMLFRHWYSQLFSLPNCSVLCKARFKYGLPQSDLPKCSEEILEFNVIHFSTIYEILSYKKGTSPLPWYKYFIQSIPYFPHLMPILTGLPYCISLRRPHVRCASWGRNGVLEAPLLHSILTNLTSPVVEKIADLKSSVPSGGWVHSRHPRYMIVWLV